jgi:hypothetical protein
MASRSRSQWRKPSLLRKFVKSKAKRSNKTSRRKPTPFSVATPTPAGSGQKEALSDELQDDTGADPGMDMDGGALPDIDSDTEPMRCEDPLAISCLNL